MRKLINSFIFRFCTTIVWILLIFYLCLLPSSKLPRFSFEHLDKIAHFILFGVLLFLLCAILKGLNYRYVLSFVLTMMLAILIEYAQLAFPNLHRSFELADVIADAVGALFFVIIHFFVSKMTREKLS